MSREANIIDWLEDKFFFTRDIIWKLGMVTGWDSDKMEHMLNICEVEEIEFPYMVKECKEKGLIPDE